MSAPQLSKSRGSNSSRGSSRIRGSSSSKGSSCSRGSQGGALLDLGHRDHLYVSTTVVSNPPFPFLLPLKAPSIPDPEAGQEYCANCGN